MQRIFAIENERLQVEIPVATMSLHVTDKATGFTWRMTDEPFDEVVIERDGDVSRHILAGSRAMSAHRLGPSALMLRFADYRLQLLLFLEENRLEVQITPEEENDRFRIKGVVYPRPFALSRSDAACLVAPFQQGLMIPGDWPEEASFGDVWDFGDEKRMQTYGELFDVDVNWWSSFRPGYPPTLINNMLMPWWGGVEAKGTFLAVLDEACWPDSYLWVTHPEGGPTTYRLMWLPSHGRLGFPRRMAFHFYEEGDYVSLCKAYREIAEAQGKCATLREKNDRNPTVGQLMGAVNTTLRFLSHDCRRFQHRVTQTFSEGADRVAAFTGETGLRLHVQVRGWQQWGHDIQYPDLVPPAPDAGGPVAFDRMAARIQEFGHVFGLGGDNYHDVAVDSPLYDESMLLRYADGSTNRRNFWASGLTSMVCAGVALKYLRRNFEVGRTDYPATKGLLETAHPDTYWIGNYISTYECYDPRHPMTRTTYWEAQREIFQYINDCGLLLNNEHPKDWAAPYFYMARTRQARTGVYGYDRSGDTLGVPVPLWGLVFHDCLITGGDNALLQMMNGSPPSIDLTDYTEGSLDRTGIHARLQAAVGYEPMVSHRFLSEDRSVQQSEFANGVVVWIDEASGRFKVNGVEDIPEREFDAGDPGKNYY